MPGGLPEFGIIWKLDESVPCCLHLTGKYVKQDRSKYKHVTLLVQLTLCVEIGRI